MAVGILLITHPGVGSAFVTCATRVLGRLPLHTGYCEVAFDEALDAALARASGAMRTVDNGDGVLVLTDLHGATPANVAARLVRLGTPARRVSGLSLPMLLRVLNYPEHTLEELQSIASIGGRNGVVLNED